MKWNVFYLDINNNIIGSYNIFKHKAFVEDCKKNFQQHSNDKIEFGINLDRDLYYYFGSKTEWEITISNEIFNDVKDKVDVYHQIRLNWDIFLDYVWVELKKEAK